MNKEAKIVYIDNKEYDAETLTDDQKKLFNKTTKWQSEALKLRDAFEDASKLHQSYLFDLKTSLNNSKEK